MKLNSTSMLFSWAMIIGVMVSISSNSWIMMWSGIEISLMSFIPLMSKNLFITSESCVKYFIIQSTSSMLMMLGLMMMMSKFSEVYKFIMETSLMIKLGSAPFHNWVLSVIEGMDYITMMNFIITMKLAPLCMLNYMLTSVSLPSTMSMIIGGIMGINQNSMRKMIGYSSIFNLGVMLAVINTSTTWMFYMSAYSVIMWTLSINLKKSKANYLNQLNFNNKKPFLNLKIWLIMLSLGGMPPTIGFMAKIMIMEYMIQNKMLMSLMIMISSTLLVMFFYMRMMSMICMFQSSKNKNKIKLNNESSMILTLLNFVSVPIMALSKSF